MMCSNCESTGFTCGGCGVNLEPEDAYIACEVKVLTEAALRLGRKEAGEEIARAINIARIARHWNAIALAAAGECAQIAREVASQPSGAASDASSGVGGHTEVGSESQAASNRVPGGSA